MDGRDEYEEIWGPEPEDEVQRREIDDHRILSWRQLDGPGARHRWFEQLWHDVCELRVRYRLPVRSRWWEDEVQVEALAAMAAWIDRYDSGDWEDPPGKLTLLFELERLETLLRDGNEPFHPQRDRPDFDRHLELLGWVEPSW
jgi:hypothetical protein